ncbi:hypothetical protein HDV00_000777 [Rhizophlyctis rosea]|nr:hypothetical protein HDV00_000777 [Rhizophlyctis rosea]
MLYTLSLFAYYIDVMASGHIGLLNVGGRHIEFTKVVDGGPQYAKVFERVRKQDERVQALSFTNGFRLSALLGASQFMRLFQQIY